MTKLSDIPFEEIKIDTKVLSVIGNIGTVIGLGSEEEYRYETVIIKWDISGKISHPFYNWCDEITIYDPSQTNHTP